MADKKDDDQGSGYEERLTWKKGDLKVYGPDGKEVDASTLEEEEDEDPLLAFPVAAQGEADLEAQAAPPTVHIHLRPEDVE